MRSVLVLVMVVSVFGKVPIVDYHTTIGIPLAARLKHAEETGLTNSRIYGGDLAVLGEFPHMGGLIVNLPGNLQSVCGSALLSDTKLVTAAHCWNTTVLQANLFTVVLGSTTLFSGGVRRDTDNVVLHPEYDFSNRNNNLAIITIEAVEFSDTISPINLPFNSFSYAGSIANIAGFGTTNDESALNRFQTLRKADLQVITNQACSQTFGDFVFDSTLCTNADLGNTCAGDAGSPLSVNTIEGWQLIGVVSFQSNRGCEAGLPTGFARISSFQTWIQRQL